MTLTGCLIQGTGPNVFLLDNAKLGATGPKEKGTTYVLSGSRPDIDFKMHLNHEVTVTGAVEPKVTLMPIPGQKVNEKDLPKLMAKTVAIIGDKCTTASH